MALQSYGKIPLFLIWSSPFDCLRATCTKSFGKAISEGRKYGRSGSFLHAFVIFFYAALLVNILYPTFLLRSRHVFYQRNFSFIADTVLDVIYALVPFVFLALGVRSQPMIIPHDPIEYDLCGNQNLRRVRAESSRRPPRRRRVDGVAV